jgi:hypothetical protein
VIELRYVWRMVEYTPSSNRWSKKKEKVLQWREKVGVNTIIGVDPPYCKYEVTDYTDWQDVPVVEEDECK